MQLVIIAGGLATRLRPLTVSIPKSLIEIDGKPFIDYQMGTLYEQGIKDVVLCLGHLGDQIERYLGNGNKFGLNILYSYETQKLLGTAGAIKNAENLLDDKFFVMYGDSYLFLDFSMVSAYFNRFNKPGLMTVFKNSDLYDRSNIVVQGNFIKIYDKKQKWDGMDYIDYGALILRKTLLKMVPVHKAYSLEELLVPLVKEHQILAYEVKKRFYEIGSLNGIDEFTKYVKGRKIDL
jgi:N-acetyl-alpha-D-muramate 1-phosphate uridylyltransferase